MSELPDLRLLQPAIEATRRHLADLDDEQIPHALRAVRLSSARRLPPPLAKVVVRELDKSEALRSEVARLLDPGDETVPATVSAAFVGRTDGWEAIIDDASSVTAERDEQAHVAKLRTKVSELEAELNRTREKLKTTRQKAASDRESAKRRLSELKQKIKTTHPPGQANELRMERVEAEAAATQARLEGELANERALVQQLRTRLLRARRSRAPGGTGVAGLGMLRSQPVEIAKSLDALSAVAAPVPAPSEDDAAKADASGAGAFGLPPGIRPDGPGAIDWLVSRSAPLVMVIDGYNAGWLIDANSFATFEGRGEVVRRASDIRKAASAPMRVIVVFDSEHGHTDETGPGSVDVRWAESADDYIRELAGTLEGDVVVVSTDREVQDGAEAFGALVLWSEAFVAWTSH